jgi:hypothetical protein
MVETKLKKKRDTVDIRFWVGVVMFAVLLPTHVFLKELPVWFLALPGLLMGLDIKSIIEAIWRK